MKSLPNLPAPIAVVGAGLSGQAAVELLTLNGVAASLVTMFDDKPGRGAYSEPTRLLAEFQPKTLVVSPGVPLSTPWIRDFEANGGFVTSELELALTMLTSERIVAVTGSVGKSTTVSLLGVAAQSMSPNNFVGGNLGVPFAAYVVDVLRGKPRAEWVVLELSSFQLEKARGLRPAGVALTSLMRNHLERYANLDEYYAVKWRLVDAARGPVVFNRRGGDLVEYAEKRNFHGALWADRDSTPFTKGDIERARLLGLHNRDNLAVAGALATALGWPRSALEAMLAFPGLPHRLQDGGLRRGVRFVNDSKATAIESVLTAVDSLMADVAGELWLLLGGRDKRLPWHELRGLANDPRVRPVFFGECGALAREASGLEGAVLPTLREALEAIAPRSRSGDVVLLSPGGTSLDEFKNFGDRGEQFLRYTSEIFPE